METIITYGIVYLLVFRLAVLLLGGLCIFWGYRLFLAPLGQEGSGTGSPDQGGELQIKRGSSSVLLKSTAPGIFFAAFGAIIVIAVLAGQQPNVGYDEQQHNPQANSQSKGTTQAVTTTRSAAVRSVAPRSAASSDAGTADYNRISKSVEIAIEDLTSTVSMAPDNPDYRDLLARLLFAWGKAKEAAAEQQRAVELVEKARREEFQARLELYQQVAR
ncbi:MAG: hypothetical protein WGN25_06725 [Candidatus Electrothrix sp. GW3-4]|uniref:hypothetical protein n=1 Tax=Candidatus Electrothrix sp. GW3-4 TaxID=3126740 RepID=UPI0030D4CD61